MAKDDDILDDAKDAFEACEERDDDNRTAALDDLKFARLAEQWHPEDEAQRRKDGRPCLTLNRMPAFIRQVVNDARQNTPAISVRPVDGKADPETAEVMSDLIRDIEGQSDADVAYDTAIDFAVTCGFGYFRINTQYSDDDSFEQDIRIGRIANPFSVYGDPESDAADSADWNVAFVIDQMKRKTFEARFKGADPVSWTDARWGTQKDPWKIDDDTLSVAEYWTREQSKKSIVGLSNGEVIDLKEYERNKALFDQQGITVIGSPRQINSHKVTQRLITGCDVLETVEWAGKYIPIVPVYGEDINVAGTRYLRSLIRDAKDPQRMFNYWRTASTELVALAPKAPFIGPKGAFKSDAAKWATANRASHAHIEYDGQVQPQRQPFTGTPIAEMNEALAASDDMKAIMGIHDASLGKQSNETSGRAIMARQREGDVSSFHFIDNLSRAIRHGGRILIDLIPKVYSTPRMVRVLGEDKQPRNVALNQPYEDKASGLTRIHDLSVGRYDLAVKAGPSFTTRREEASAQMIEMVRANSELGPLIGDLIAENLDWPGAEEIAKRLRAILPPQIQAILKPKDGEQPQGQPQPGQGPQGGAPAGAPDPSQAIIQQGMQIIQQLKQELAETNAKLQAKEQDATIDVLNTKIKAYDAETKRMGVLVPHLVPDPLEPDAAQPAPAAQGQQTA